MYVMSAWLVFLGWVLLLMMILEICIFLGVPGFNIIVLTWIYRTIIVFSGFVIKDSYYKIMSTFFN